MKKLIMFSAAVILLLFSPQAQAQFEQHYLDLYLVDTLDIVCTKSSVPGTGQPKLRLDVYVFDDATTVTGATMGFGWSNPNLRMDSARASTLLAQAFDYGRWFYYGGSLALTNSNRKFILGGVSLSPPAMLPHPTRQLWASYYFTMTSWTSTDSVVFDTARFNSGSKLSFATAWGPYVPYWTGKETVKFGCCIARTGNVDGDPQDGCDMSDLSALIDYLYVSLTPPPCMAEANCDGSLDGVVDIGDLTALTDFLFVTFTPTAMCP